MKNSQIKKAPYKLKRCDQVVFVDGNRILNYYNYSNRDESFFEISAYVANVFDEKDKEKIIDSIHLTHLTKMPDVIPGSKLCLDIYDSKYGKRFAMCLKDEEILKQIQTVFQDFYRCRMGDNLQNPFKNIVEICKENAMKKDGSLFDEKKKNKKPKIELNPFYSSLVPGSKLK